MLEKSALNDMACYYGYDSVKGPYLVLVIK
jgi:hypothetical protein